MVDAALIITIVIVLFLFSIANIYFIAYFQSPEDKNAAYLPKVLVILGLTLAELSVLMLPLDVANRTTNGGIPMGVLWEIVYMAIAILAIVVIPFGIFYYEAEDPDEEGSATKQFTTAIKWILLCIVVAVLIIVLMWIFLGFADISVRRIYAPLGDANIATNTADYCTGDNCAVYTSIAIQVTLPIYIISLLTFVGWFFFILFGGIGLVALPVDLISDYVHRPRPIGPDVFAKRKIQIRDRAAALIEKGEKYTKNWKLLGKMKRKDKVNYNKFKAEVYQLEEDFERVKMARNGGGNIIFWWFKLALGIIGAFVSLTWVLQVILYVFIFPPVTPFLNNLFIALDSVFPLLGTLCYGIASFYLLWCVIKGNMRFGLRFLFFTIHPMKVGATMMNSFLFNTLLILLCALPVVQFCTTAFNEYARLTTIDLIFGVQVKNLRFLKYFWVFYIYAFLSIALLTGLYFLIRKRKTVYLGRELDNFN